MSIDTNDAEVSIDERGVVVRYVGVLTGEGVQRAVGVMMAHPRFAPSLPTVWDFSAVTPAVGLERHEMKKLAATVGPLRAGAGRPRVAIVVAGESNFGGARMFGAVGAGSLHAEYGVFRERPAAEAWAFGDDGRDDGETRGPFPNPNGTSAQQS